MKTKPSLEDIQEDFEVYGIQLGDNSDVHEKCKQLHIYWVPVRFLAIANSASWRSNSRHIDIEIIQKREPNYSGLQLCDEYDLTGEQIAVCWLGFATAKDYDELTKDRLETFEKEELKKKTSTVIDTISDDLPFQHTPKHVVSTADDELLAAYGASPATSSKTNRPSHDASDSPSHIRNAKRGLSWSQSVPNSPLAPSLSQSPGSSLSQRYSLRTNSGTVVSSFPKANLTPETWIADSLVEPLVQQIACGGVTPLNTHYNYMFEKLRDCSDILDDTVINLGDQIKESLCIEDLAHPQSASNESVWCVGRVCCDSIGRLNAASVLLEGDLETCSGATVPLDLSALHTYALFPGQVVAVKGINTTGNKLVAEEIVIGRCLQPSLLPITIDDRGINVCIACGPFTTSENLLYEPLTDLLIEIVSNPPHILILMGPLLDTNHPLLSDAMLGDSYDSILNRGLEKIDTACQQIPTLVFIMTSFWDICCPMVFPTPPMFLSGSLPADSKIKLLPDPSVLSIGGVTVALTTNDVLMQISREEISFPPQSSDRLTRLVRHLLLQQSFYPLYPAPEDFCLNLEQADMHARLPFTPHILVVPSEFKGFIKETDDCVVINPERLAKGKIGGCYVKMAIKPHLEKKPMVEAQIVRI